VNTSPFFNALPLTFSQGLRLNYLLALELVLKPNLLKLFLREVAVDALFTCAFAAPADFGDVGDDLAPLAAGADLGDVGDVGDELAPSSEPAGP